MPKRLIRRRCFSRTRAMLAVADPGAQASIINLDTANKVDLAAAGREGNPDYALPIVGASGTEMADISDALGLYMTHLGNAQATTSSISGATIAAGAPVQGM